MSIARLMTRDPWKTTRLIGRTCKGRDTFSEAVRMVDGFLVPSGPRPRFDRRRCTGQRMLVSAQHARQACRVDASKINQIHLTCLGGGLTVATGFAGDQRSGETPDPIPNSEVKPGPPMILPRGKVGHCRRFQPRSRKVAGLSFLRFLFRSVVLKVRCLP